MKSVLIRKSASVALALTLACWTHVEPLQFALLSAIEEFAHVPRDMKATLIKDVSLPKLLRLLPFLLVAKEMMIALTILPAKTHAASIHVAKTIHVRPMLSAAYLDMRCIVPVQMDTLATQPLLVSYLLSQNVESTLIAPDILLVYWKSVLTHATL